MAKVSILMNGYNSEKYLKEAIDSVYAQTFDDWEIVFIDNCSIDSTKNIVDSYDNKIKYYKTETTIPLGAARNFGLKYCDSEYLAFLDTDDIWLSTKLEKQIQILENNKECFICYGGVVYIDENSEEIGRFLPVDSKDNLFSIQLKNYEINMQSVLLRTFDGIEFNETLKHSPDFDLFLDIISKYKGCSIKDYLVKYRRLSNSLTSKNIAFWGSEMEYTLDKIFKEDPSLKTKYPKEYNLAYAKVAYNKARYYISIGEKSKAINELSKYKFSDYRYFILYVVSLFPSAFWDMLHRYR